ncbi:NAD-dependent epimerase/dehydratase family protein [Nitriliruptoraceae bacterium ZYF776]|nr:NAD-dependent epimerase/dehydratase family protein [Profundirhabdus halotolerans]
MRVTVTGGAGFIGSNLVGTLVRTPGITAVQVIDDLSTGFRANLDPYPQVRLHEGSILDAALLREVFTTTDAVIHLAARPSVPRSISDPVASHEANATGTLRVLEAAREAGGLHTVVASSSSVYGGNPTLPKSEDLKAEPLSPYAVSKLAAETYALAYATCFELPVLPFRFFNVFGPGQPAGHAYAAVVPAFIDAAMQGVPIPRHGDGEQSRDFTYVGTVADVLTRAVLGRVTSDTAVNLAFGSRRTINDVIDELGRQLDIPLAIAQLPDRAGDVRHSQADQRRLLSLFPDVAPVPFETGLAATIDWFRARMPATVGVA